MFIPEFGADKWDEARQLIKGESGFNPHAVNKSSGACGMPQALPCSKLLTECITLDDVVCQARWMVKYIRNRYTDPEVAYAEWLNRSPHWY